MRKAAFVLPFFLLVAASPSAAAVTEEQLAPFTPWHVDWTAMTCKMQRGFGDAKNFVVIQIERFAPYDSFQLVVTGARLKSLGQGGRLLVSYGSQAAEKAPYYQTGKVADGTPSVFISSSLASQGDDDQPSAPVTPQMEAAATSVNLAWSGKKLVLKTGPLDKAFAALRTCTDDLVKTWGLDPVVQQSLMRRAVPKSNPGHWASPEDYPKEALRSGQQAIVNFRLSVDISGKPTACEVQRSYSGEAFDKRTCQILMARARFEPALDAAGAPVASYYVNTVRWSLP